MQLRYNYRLYPSPGQQQALARAFGCARFRVEASFGLIPALRQLGVDEAFGDGADFSGITEAERLRIGTVVHKAYIDVDRSYGGETPAFRPGRKRVGLEQQACVISGCPARIWRACAQRSGWSSS